MLFYGAFTAGKSIASFIGKYLENIPEQLDFLIPVLGGAAVIISLLLAAVLSISLLGVLYECFGGLFFDTLIEKFSYKRYGVTPVQKNLRFDVVFLLDSALYGIKTLLLSLPLALLCLVFPVGGQMIFAVIMGYRFGKSYPVAAGYCRNMSFRETSQRLESRTSVIAGFGITAYVILMLFPLAMIFLLPGIVLGGVILLQEECFDNSKL